MAAPFGLSVLDIVKGIELAHEICSRCLDRRNGADVQYQQLVDDIRILSSSLQKLQAVAGDLAPQSWQSNGAAQQSSRTEEGLLPSSIGNFNQTLRQCCDLLAAQGYLRNGHSSAGSNLQWWCRAERDVEKLKTKLKWHIDTIQMYLKPDELATAVRIDRQIELLRQQVANLEFDRDVSGSSRRLWSIVLTNELKEKLEEGLTTEKPLWLSQSTDWPLSDGFRAFDIHFDKGTVNISLSSNVEDKIMVSGHLNLAKAIFILIKLKEASYLRTLGIDSVWSDRMLDAQVKVRTQLHRYEMNQLQRPQGSTLLSLASDMYRLAEIDRENEPMMDASMPRPSEEKILEIGLSSAGKYSQASLLVIREGDRDSAGFRLVVLDKSPEGAVTQVHENADAYMDRDRLIPLYAIPSHPAPDQQSFLLLNHEGRRPKEFAFGNSADLGRFQQALTGYRLHHNSTLKGWRTDSSPRLGDYGRGSMQLWQYKPLDAFWDSEVASMHSGRLIEGNSREQSLLSSSRRELEASSLRMSSDSPKDGHSSGLHISHGPQDLECEQKASSSNQESNDNSGPNTPTLSKRQSFLSKARKKSSKKVPSVTSKSSSNTYGSSGSVKVPDQGGKSRAVELQRPKCLY